MYPNTTEQKVADATKALNIDIPLGTLPLALRLIALFTLLGGLGMVSSLFVDIGRPSGSIAPPFYILRLVIGTIAVLTAYAMIRRNRGVLWLYGALTLIGLYFNPVSAVIPFLVLMYLYIRREDFKPTALDNTVHALISTFRNKS